MREAIYLDGSQVPASLRGSYSGTKFRVRVTESVTIPCDAGLWSGGTRDDYRALRIADGASVAMPGQDAAPWSRGGDRTVALQPGIAVVNHSMFCGKDMGLTFYLHPADAAPMLPAAAVELTEVERLVLRYTASRKSSYMGKDRYAQMVDDINPCWRPREERKAVPTRVEWEAAKVALIGRGMLNKAGAITPAGRNADRR